MNTTNQKFGKVEYFRRRGLTRSLCVLPDGQPMARGDQRTTTSGIGYTASGVVSQIKVVLSGALREATAIVQAAGDGSRSHRLRSRN